MSQYLEFLRYSVMTLDELVVLRFNSPIETVVSYLSFSDEDYLGSRLQPLDPIPNPPQRSDPREFDDMPGGVYSQQKVK